MSRSIASMTSTTPECATRWRRSCWPRRRGLVRSVDTSRALAMPGVRAVLTAADLPTDRPFGLDESHRDQPVLVAVGQESLYAGEPVALVGADHPEQARAACAAIRVDYEEREPLTDPVQALLRGQTLRN